MKNPSQSYLHRIQNDHCRLSFDVLSDLHVTLPLKDKCLYRALEDIWNRKTKTVLLLGDLSNNGYMFQLQRCLLQLKEYPFHYVIALGNHDTYRATHPQQIHIHPLYKELVLNQATHLYYEVTIHGFHFFVLNSERGDKSHAYYSTQQMFWLKEHLEKVAKDQPVFVICHHPMKDTHLHSDEKELSMGVQQHDLLRILKTHPHVFFFSGHIHNSYEECNIKVDNTLFEIDVPSFRKTQYGNKKEEIGYHIELYHDFLYLQTRDYAHAMWIPSHSFILDFKTHHCYLLDVH